MPLAFERMHIWLISLVLAIATYSGAAMARHVEKIIYHIHSTNPNSFQRTVSNLENLHKGMPDRELKIKILLQGESLQLLDPTLHPDTLNQRFARLLANGAELETSRQNWLEYSGKAQVIQPPALVGNIFDRIIELEKQGYRYITP